MANYFDDDVSKDPTELKKAKEAAEKIVNGILKPNTLF